MYTSSFVFLLVHQSYYAHNLSRWLRSHKYILHSYIPTFQSSNYKATYMLWRETKAYNHLTLMKPKHKIRSRVKRKVVQLACIVCDHSQTWKRNALSCYEKVFISEIVLANDVIRSVVMLFDSTEQTMKKMRISHHMETHVHVLDSLQQSRSSDRICHNERHLLFVATWTWNPLSEVTSLHATGILAGFPTTTTSTRSYDACSISTSACVPCAVSENVLSCGTPLRVWYWGWCQPFETSPDARASSVYVVKNFGRNECAKLTRWSLEDAESGSSCGIACQGRIYLC